ncbi:MAG: ABC transporter substrate-binding protein [Acidobacteriota bacterium]|nr:ABC transporter substrate-binding protein [Acidobacteriota bacterium]
MSRIRLGLILFLLGPVLASAAIKPNYAGEARIRLGEPATFAFSPSNYSNLVFYALIYENFFYLEGGGRLRSHLFSAHHYDKEARALVLELGRNLSFSDGSPVTPGHIIKSLEAFVSRNLHGARQLGKQIRRMRVEKNSVVLELTSHLPDAVFSLAVPELILQADRESVFSGPFVPVEWEQGRHILLKANPRYPGGRSYLDHVRVIFTDEQNPDIFLATPGRFDAQRFEEHNAGIFQNIYLSFPGERVGENTRMALFSLFREFFLSRDYSELNSLTSDTESPVTINMRRLPAARVRSVLRSSRIQVYLQSSLKREEENLLRFLNAKGVSIQTLFVEDGQLNNFIDGAALEYVILEKVFQQRMPLAEKLHRVVSEMTFGRFNAQYLQLVGELEEVSRFNSDEMLLDQVAKIVGLIIEEGFLIPLCQKRYSLFVNRKLRGFRMDVYGRPLLQGVYLP